MATNIAYETFFHGELVYEVLILSLRHLPRRTKVRKLVRDEIFERDRRCVRCMSDQDLQIDHIIPVMCGGSNDPSNLRALCRKCNGKRNLGYTVESATQFVWRSRQ